MRRRSWSSSTPMPILLWIMDMVAYDLGSKIRTPCYFVWFLHPMASSFPWCLFLKTLGSQCFHNHLDNLEGKELRIFENKSSSLPQLQELVLLRMSWWIKGWGDPFPYSIQDILSNPTCLLWSHLCRLYGFHLPSITWNGTWMHHLTPPSITLQSGAC